MMTEVLTKIVVNCETGEQTVVPLSAQELSDRAAAVAAFEAEQARVSAAQAAHATAKASAEGKLKALGLSDAEIAALLN